MTRRVFEHLILVVMPVVYAGGILAASVRFLSPFPRGRRKESLDVGSLADFQPGGRVVRVEFNGRVVYVLHDGSELRAFDAECTHLQCNVAWNEPAGVFHCACHGGRFDRNGQVSRPPPKDPLMEYVVEDPAQNGGRVILRDRMKEA